jgi:hypothetical protein
VYGAVGTLGTIVASITAGALFALDIHLPFYTFTVVMVVSLVVGLAIGGGALRNAAVAGNAGAPDEGAPDGRAPATSRTGAGAKATT